MNLSRELLKGQNAAPTPASARQQPNENANDGVLELRNRPPGTTTAFPGKDIVDAASLSWSATASGSRAIP